MDCISWFSDFCVSVFLGCWMASWLKHIFTPKSLCGLLLILGIGSDYFYALGDGICKFSAPSFESSILKCKSYLFSLAVLLGGCIGMRVVCLGSCCCCIPVCTWSLNAYCKFGCVEGRFE